MPPLFRPEALAHRQQQWLGRIYLLQPLPLRLLSGLALLAVAGVICFLFSAEYSRKARLGGQLVPDRGVLRLSPAQAGRVLARPVTEGQRVKAGEVLYVLALEGHEQVAEGLARNLEQREQTLDLTARQQQRLQDKQAQGLEQRAQALQREQAQLTQELTLQAQRQTLAQEALKRLEALRADQFVSSAQVQAKQEELLALQAKQQALVRQREALQRELVALQAEQREQPLRSEVQQSELSRDLAALKALRLEAEARRRLVLRAPSDGQLSTLGAEPGQSVPADRVLATLLPAGTHMQAQLYAPSSAIGFMRPGQQVLLRYQAFPYQKFGHQHGVVLQITRSPLSPGELDALNLPAALTHAGEPLYRVTVQLERQTVQAYGDEQALSAGMQLDADVLLERRRLIEWIFEPLLSLARRV